LTPATAQRVIANSSGGCDNDGRSLSQEDRQTMRFRHLNWHAAHRDKMSMGARIADAVANFIGSWQFIIIQSGIFVVWVVFNTIWLFTAYEFDPYPFILFNLFMSAEAAYASPLILMSQNRQSERDRIQAEHDYETNVAAKEEIETILRELARLELEKLDRILAILQKPAQQTAG
jgi:uncharacterized membrane protein